MKNWLRKLFKKSQNLPYVRGWNVAESNRFLNDWIKYLSDINSDLHADLESIRSRCKDMVQNSAFFNKYLYLRSKNIFGEHGIQLQMKAKDENGTYLRLPEARISGRA